MTELKKFGVIDLRKNKKTKVAPERFYIMTDSYGKDTVHISLKQHDKSGDRYCVGYIDILDDSICYFGPQDKYSYRFDDEIINYLISKDNIKKDAGDIFYRFN